MSKAIYPPELKRQLVEKYLNNEAGVLELSREYGIHKSSLWQWVQMYKEHGSEAFTSKRAYTKEEKETCVREVLDGEGSIHEIAAKHNLSAPSVLRGWLKHHIEGKELTDYVPHPEDDMAAKTTFEERIDIVNYCVDHEMNYKETAEHFHVSYAQVYDWMKKYLSKGESALEDRRGRRKPDNELDETERLRRDNKRLQAALDESERRNQLLKKVLDFERGSVSAR